MSNRKLTDSSSYDEVHWLHQYLTGESSEGDGGLLTEADDLPAKPPATPGAPAPKLLPKDSIDVMIDAQILKAEQAAKPKMGVAKESRLRSLFILKEAGDDPVAGPATVGATNFDATRFATEIARVIDNAASMFDLQGTVLRRSLNYVTKHHGQLASKQLESVLKDDFDISNGRKEDSDEPHPDFNAAGAGPEV